MSRRASTIKEVSEKVQCMGEFLEAHRRQELSKPDQEALQVNAALLAEEVLLPMTGRTQGNRIQGAVYLLLW